VLKHRPQPLAQKMPAPESSKPANYTRLPNYLVDHVMPRLRDTEWRIVLVVLRQTIGWRSASPTGRRLRDWLTQSQLKRRTGRGSEAISHAIRSLIERGLLIAENSRGQSLATTRQRRTLHDRIYYRLSPALTDTPRRNR
jgi:phage replication O-like protein O